TQEITAQRKPRQRGAEFREEPSSVTTALAVSIDKYHNTKRLRRVRDVMAITKMRFLPCVCLRRVEPVKSIGCDGDGVALAAGGGRRPPKTVQHGAGAARTEVAAYKLKLAVRFAVWSNSGQPPIMGLWTSPTQPMNWTAFVGSWTDWSPRNSRLGVDLWMSVRRKSTS